MISIKLRTSRLWKEHSTPEEFLLRYDGPIQTLDNKGIQFRQTPWMVAAFSILTDDYEIAVPASEEMLDGWSVTTHWWKFFEEQNRNTQILNMPGIASRLEAFKAEDARWRKEIVAVLQTPDWAM